MGKHTEARLRRVNQIQALRRLLEQRVKQWLVELDSNQRAKEEVVERLCRQLSRELGKVRVRAGEAQLPGLADLAGEMAVAVTRPRAADFKVRAMREGMVNLHKALDEAMLQTMSVEFARKRSEA